LPWGFIGAGALIGAVIVFIDEGLRRKASLFRMPVLAVAVGIYLPLELSTPIFIGGLIAFWINGSLAGGTGSGLLFAAGLITGEALIGIALAVPIAVTGNPEVLALAPASRLGSASGILAMLAVAAALIRVASTVDSPRKT